MCSWSMTHPGVEGVARSVDAPGPCGDSPPSIRSHGRGDVVPPHQHGHPLLDGPSGAVHQDDPRDGHHRVVHGNEGADPAG